MMETVHTKEREKLLDLFPELKNCGHDLFLSLKRYLDCVPERFYSESIFTLVQSFLKNEQKNDHKRLTKKLNQKIQVIDKAFNFLSEINYGYWHDLYEEIFDYGFIRFCDSTLHPTYLKLIEGILYPFILIIAEYSRENRGKSIDGLDVYNCVDELKNSSFSALSLEYNNILRNGIAHGGITFRDKENKYSDKRGNEIVIDHRGLLNKIDNLIDTCNAIALAFKLFFSVNLHTKISTPRQFMVEELQSVTKCPWWEIEGCLPSEAMGKSQLNIYAKPKSRDYNKVHYLAILTGVLSESLQPGFERYFVSLRTNHSWPGWAAFYGKKLKDAREKTNPALEDYEGALEENLVFFVPNFKLPRIFGKLDSFWQSFRIHIPLAFDEVRNQISKTIIQTRISKVHRNGWRLVLNASLVMEIAKDEDFHESFKKSCKKIVKKAFKHAKRQSNLSLFIRYLPLGYARISVFKKDYRIRKLTNFGLGSDLIGTVEIKKIKKINAPDIFGSTIEKYRKYRIAWNRAFLDSTDATY